MKATLAQWAIALLLLGLITRGLLAQSALQDWDAYPAPMTSPYPAPQLPTIPPRPNGIVPPRIIPTSTSGSLSVFEEERPVLGSQESKRPKRASHQEPAVEPTPQPAPFLPSPEDVAVARRYAQYVEERLLSDAGWWK